MRCHRFLNSKALSTENYLDFQMNKILEKNKNWGGVCFLSHYKKKLPIYIMGKTSWLQRKKNCAYPRDAQFRDIICQNHVIVFKEGRIFFAKELKVDCKWTKGHTTDCLCICYQINKAKIIDQD